VKWYAKEQSCVSLVLETHIFDVLNIEKY
jgi:hypothetical protein